MNRRDFLRLAAVGSAQAVAGSHGEQRPGTGRSAGRVFREKAFKWSEGTISQMQAAIASGKETAVSLAEQYLSRIEEIDASGPSLRSVIQFNPDAVPMARALDRERKSRGSRGPLHGIPLLLKDNIDTADRLLTTAGSLALVRSRPKRDSFVVQQLRQAGAVILGKTNLSEWANFRSGRSTSGWSARGGQTKNPYVLDRNPSGSSSGSAVAVSANLCAVAVGTETDGSILSPASYNGIVGIKPTVGLVSRAGIIPISQSQDTAGPMARTVSDAAILLAALSGLDPRDPATGESRGHEKVDYSSFLDRGGLRGARLGVARQYFERAKITAKVMESALASLKSSGAILVDPVEIPSQGKVGEAEFEVLLYEFKDGLNRYLADCGGEPAVRTLQELIDFNERNRERELPYFGQETFLKAQEKGPLTDEPYRTALEKTRRLSRAEGIDAVMDEHRLDAIVAPTTGPAHVTDLVHGDRGTGGSTSLAAMAGYPSITVPAGQILGLPVGISFFGRAYSESTLIKLAYAFEQAAPARPVPRFLPTTV